MSELTMFVYPWDLAIEGPEHVASELADHGVTRMAVAAAYHSAEVIAPRRRTAVLASVDANCAHLPLPEDAFSGLRLRSGELATGRPDLFGAIESAAAGAGLGLTGWVVLLHNSALATQHPHTSLENAFGDRSAHGLCPANPQVRTFAAELVDAVAAKGHFDTILAESASYLLAGHGHPHELWAVRLDPRCRLLLSLCFCEHCSAAARGRGLDAAALKERCAARLSQTWNSVLGPYRGDDEGLEVAALLVEDRELAEFVRLRCEVVDGLMELLAARVRPRGLRLAVTTAVWGRPAPSNWFEGVDLRRSGEIADEVCLTTYSRDLKEVGRDLDHVLEAVPARMLTAINTLWPRHHASPEELTAKIDVARNAGVTSFALYNYATAPAPVLGWVDRVAKAIGNT